MSLDGRSPAGDEASEGDEGTHAHEGTDDEGTHGGEDTDGLLSTIDSLPLAPALVGGIGSFVGGFALFVTVVAASGNPNFGTPIRTLKQLGGLFYNAQNVPLVQHREIVVGEDVLVQEGAINVIQQAEPSLPPLVYYAVPVLAIATVAGLLAYAYLDSSRPFETATGIVTGMTVGYVLAALVGTVLVAQRTSQGEAFETLAPATAWALGYGVAYPLAISTLVVGVAVGWGLFNGPTDAASSDAQA